MFWPHCEVWGVLVPQLGIEPGPLAVKVPPDCQGVPSWVLYYSCLMYAKTEAQGRQLI